MQELVEEQKKKAALLRWVEETKGQIAWSALATFLFEYREKEQMNLLP
jgi:hypothetical protein